MTWNEEMERYETTGKSIRPFPEGLRGRVKSYVAMCDPYKGTCRRKQCTFAHGKAEQESWNKILKDSSVKEKGTQCVVFPQESILYFGQPSLNIP